MPLNAAGSQGGVGSCGRDPSSSQLLVPGKGSWQAEAWEARLGHYRHLVAHPGHGRGRGGQPSGANENKGRLWVETSGWAIGLCRRS